MGISSVANTVGSKGLGALSKFKPAQRLCQWFKRDPLGAIAGSTIASVAIKDGVGCAMYVYQSINNDKIPEKRRKFVAALDLTNGVLMIASQIAMFFAMRKLNDKLFHGLFNKVFDKGGKAFKAYAEQIRADQKAAGLTPVKKYILKKGYEGLKNDTFGVFKFVTELAAATIGAKRILVPFIATPLASKVEKWMNKKAGNDTAEQTEDKSNPSMKGNNTEVVKVPAKIETPARVPGKPGSTNLLEQYIQNK